MEFFLPIRNHLQAAIKLADSFVSNLKKIGIEKRRVRELDIRAGHGLPRGFAHGVGEIFVLDATPRAQSLIEIIGRIPAGKNFGMARAQRLIDDDAVINLQTCRNGEFDIRHDADTGDNPMATVSEDLTSGKRR